MYAFIDRTWPWVYDMPKEYVYMYMYMIWFDRTGLVTFSNLIFFFTGLGTWSITCQNNMYSHNDGSSMVAQAHHGTGTYLQSLIE